MDTKGVFRQVGFLGLDPTLLNSFLFRQVGFLELDPMDLNMTIRTHGAQL